MKHDAENEAHLKSAAYIPDMIEHAVFISEEKNTKDKTFFDSYRYYVVGLNMGGVDYTAKIVIGVKNGEAYYDHSLTEIEKSSLIESIDPINTGFADNKAAVSAIKDKRLSSILQTNSSKVVDENGEPLVVYRGTVDDEATRAGKAGKRTYDSDLSAFTVFKRVNDSVRSSGELSNLDKRNVSDYVAFLNLRNPLVIDAKGAYSAHIEFNGDEKSAYEWSAFAEGAGFDGVIFHNVRDGVGSESVQKPTGDYVAFKADQIKSVSDHVSAFPKGGDDISRKMLGENEMTAEESRIVENAKANGTYLKAPNGRPSNLAPKQWSLVRTEAFRKQFGEWEELSWVVRMRRKSPVILGKTGLSGKAISSPSDGEDFIRRGLDEEYEIADTGERVLILKECDLSKTAVIPNNAPLRSVTAIPSMLRKAVFLREERDTDEVRRIYATGLQMDGEDYTTKITVIAKGGRKFYDHSRTQIRRGSVVDYLGAKVFTPEEEAGNARLIKNDELLAFLQRRTDFSEKSVWNHIPLDETLFGSMINERFNNDLERQQEGSLPPHHTYQLGRPGRALLDAGLPDRPIELEAKRLLLQAFFGGESGFTFSLTDIQDLPEALASPVAVFDTGKKGTFAVLTDLKSGEERLIALLKTGRKSGRERFTVEIRDAQSLFPHLSTEGLFVSQSERLRWIDKQKALHMLSLSPNFSSASAIVAESFIRTFTNPTTQVSDEVNREVSSDTPVSTWLVGNAYYCDLNGEPVAERLPDIGDRLREEINRKFNDELQQLIDGALPEEHIFQLGMPGKALLEAGTEDVPICLAASTLKLKASEEYKSRHPFSFSDIFDLPRELYDPIATFQSTTQPSVTVLIPQQNRGRNFIVALREVKKSEKGAFSNSNVNSIRSLYPKNTPQSLFHWLSGKDNLLKGLNHMKAFAFLKEHQAFMSVTESRQKLYDAAFNKLMQYYKREEENDIPNATVPEPVVAVPKRRRRRLSESRAVWMMGFEPEKASEESSPKEEQKVERKKRISRSGTRRLPKVIRSASDEELLPTLSMEEINRQFNLDLREVASGVSDREKQLRLGKPGTVLLEMGVPPMEFFIDAQSIERSSNNPHGRYNMLLLENLPLHFQHPLAIFKQGESLISMNIILPIEHEGRKFMAGIHLNHEVKKGKEGHRSGNRIVTIYPKNTLEWLNWISDKQLLYVGDKEQLIAIAEHFYGANPAEVAEMRKRRIDIDAVISEISRFSNAQAAQRSRKKRIDIKIADSGEKPSSEAREREGKGWYDPQTGEIFLRRNAHSDLDDLQATLLHEVVGHKGLREVLGKHYPGFVRQLLQSMTPEERKEVASEAHRMRLREDDGTLAHNDAYWESRAVEEYLAQKAEANNAPDLMRRIIAAIRAFFRNILDVNLRINDDDIRYLLWKSAKRMEKEGFSIEELIRASA